MSRPTTADQGVAAAARAANDRRLVAVDSPRSATGLWQLTQLPDISSARAITLAGAYPSWDRLRGADDADLRRLTGSDRIAAALDGLDDPDLPALDRPVGTDIAGFFDPSFPDRLRHIPGPPALLWFRGDLTDTGGLAIVGTRKPTTFGTRVTDRAARTAAAAGLATISGLADGVDCTAATSTLAGDGRHIAIVGCGIDALHGHQRPVADAIVNAGGAVVSEQPPGTRRSGRTLATRNRLQSGLADAVLITQCGLPSGTLHTARFAIAQGRPLWAASPSGEHAAHPSSAGSVALCDPSGAPASALKASGRLGALIANRRPCADEVIVDGSMLDGLIGRLAAASAA